jgi:hypothetical protein
MIHHFDDIYYKSCLLSKPFEKQVIKDLFSHIHEHCEQASCSEIIDLNNYKIFKSAIKSRAILRAYLEKPFIFVHCLN